jgi:hypothetical protein
MKMVLPGSLLEPTLISAAKVDLAATHTLQQLEGRSSSWSDIDFVTAQSAKKVLGGER